VIANPQHRLQENLKNNIALRKVVLGCKPGTVTVPRTI
jgi:hypothetical protein